MRFLCLIHLNEAELAAIPEAELGVLNEQHVAVARELQESGHLIQAEPLSPSKLSACVRVRDGRAAVVDGPFAETKEVVGGFYLIEAADQAEALQIAARIPAARLWTVEVRPTMHLAKDGEVIW